MRNRAKNALGLHQLVSRKVCTCPQCRRQLVRIARVNGMTVEHLLEVMRRSLASPPRQSALAKQGGRRVPSDARPEQPRRLPMTAPVAERVTVADRGGQVVGPAAILAVVRAIRE